MIKGIKPGLAECGKIKIGRLSEEERTAKSGKKWRAPIKLDHFLVTKTYRDSTGQLIIDDTIMASLAKDPDGACREIPILLHSDAIDEVFPTTYAAYAQRSLACRGDGEKATRWKFDGKVRTNEATERKCPCEYLTEPGPNGEQRCKPHGTLHCTIALPGHAIAGAVYRWRTTGIISIQRMIGSLQQILAAVGTLTRVPLVLRIEPVQVSPQGKQQTVYSCHVELRATDLLQAQTQALEARKVRALLGPPIDTKLLVQAPASDDETPEEQSEVAEEFFPPSDETGAISPQRVADMVKEAAKKTAESTINKKEVTEEATAMDYGEPDPN